MHVYIDCVDMKTRDNGRSDHRRIKSMTNCKKVNKEKTMANEVGVRVCYRLCFYNVRKPLPEGGGLMGEGSTSYSALSIKWTNILLHSVTGRTPSTYASIGTP